MVSVVIKRDQSGDGVGFSCNGHAGYAEKGSDVICAAISTLTWTAVLALEKLTKIRLKIQKNAAKGRLECCWNSIPAEMEKVNLIIQVMVIGLQDIAAQYPEYLNVSEVEV